MSHSFDAIRHGCDERNPKEIENYASTNKQPSTDRSRRHPGPAGAGSVRKKGRAVADT